MHVEVDEADGSGLLSDGACEGARLPVVVAGGRSDRLHTAGQPLVVKMHFSSEGPVIPTDAESDSGQSVHSLDVVEFEAAIKHTRLGTVEPED